MSFQPEVIKEREHSEHNAYVFIPHQSTKTKKVKRSNELVVDSNNLVLSSHA